MVLVCREVRLVTGAGLVRAHVDDRGRSSSRVNHAVVGLARQAVEVGGARDRRAVPRVNTG